MEYSTRLLYKDKMHPEIYNSNIPMHQKLWLQERLEYFKGNFDKLLEDIEKYAILPEIEEYEKAAIIRDYRKTIVT
jgi:protein-arginine kinase activator protein McsA